MDGEHKDIGAAIATKIIASPESGIIPQIARWRTQVSLRALWAPRFGNARRILMSWIPPVSKDQASPEVKRIYDFLAENWGFVPNYFLALGGDPQLLQDQVNLFTHVMFEPRTLPKQIKEQVALVVSGINLSNYCLAAHLEILGRMGIDKSLSRKLALDYTNASVEPKVMELFRFADKLTRHPADIEKPDVDRLRAAGWDDAAILETVLVVSLYACANRFSAGVGLVADF